METGFKRVDAENLERAMSKKTALLNRFPEGHVFLKADVRVKV